ncbi:Initiation-specific alpha-1,6-mannosyltransferase [Tolypocladium ophioglossoides CBS 100239]|uniref:Initiation-specific alpha-1,6-mannosyltransferase n=1 Tax=Tolypocladium ophioglossoides (strain CBS 100239) TaxID=1163406 RepID=A0A0L0MZE6_TOLOC|nr:Initiation-specific alpha-1,6-mannosyltransferase [Tolypocladium ophioglossoides CBS 100239]
MQRPGAHASRHWLAVMLLSYGSLRFRPRVLLLSAAVFAATLWMFLWVDRQPAPSSPDAQTLERDYPLTWKHVQSSNGTGGAWYIPPEWIGEGQREPQTIIEAARLASNAAASDHHRQLAFSNIPLLVHQTSATAQVTRWKPDVLPWVEQWLQYSVASNHGSPMAYFFWDDEGILAFMREFESGFLDDFNALFTPVERADIFRILTCKWFGGVYADVDTEPLKHPATWIGSADLAVWTDEVTGSTYGHEFGQGASSASDKASSRLVNLLWGLEADTDPQSDAYWRMGYTYPVQLTQWALASAPKHPVLSQFMVDLKAQISEAKKAGSDAANTSAAATKADPLTRTGPAAVTLATSTWLEKKIGFRWNALTGLKDGGRAKLVSDVLVLPITGFSPGRGKYGNMGSKPVTDPDARLHHHALGSWRRFDLIVEYGKFCRTMFGMCKTWTKVPG